VRNKRDECDHVGRRIADRPYTIRRIFPVVCVKFLGEEHVERRNAGAAFAAILVVLGQHASCLIARARSRRCTVQDRFSKSIRSGRNLPTSGSRHAIGVWVDEQDNVWIIHRSSSTLSFRDGARRGGESTYGRMLPRRPPVAGVDQAGNLVRGFVGRPAGYELATVEPGISSTTRERWIGFVCLTPPRREDATSQVHEGRQVLMKVGKIGGNKGRTWITWRGRMIFAPRE